MKFPTFFGTGTQSLTTFLTRPQLCSICWSRSYLAHNLPFRSFQIHSNIILLSTSRSSSWYLPLRFYRQNPARVPFVPPNLTIWLQTGRSFINRTQTTRKIKLQYVYHNNKNTIKSFIRCLLRDSWFGYVRHEDRDTSKQNFTHKLKNSLWREAARHIKRHLQNYYKVWGRIVARASIKTLQFWQHFISFRSSVRVTTITGTATPMADNTEHLRLCTSWLRIWTPVFDSQYMLRSSSSSHGFGPL